MRDPKESGLAGSAEPGAVVAGNAGSAEPAPRSGADAAESTGARRVLVVGAGVMGSSIALVFARAGSDVRLVDVDDGILSRAMGLIESGLETLADADTLTRAEMPGILARISPSTDLAASAAGTDFVIEAVPEVADLKRRIFARLEAVCPMDAVIASNTSGLDVFGIAELEHPERLVIAHFFAPAHIIPLVEVVPGCRTAPAVVERTRAVLEGAGKTPVVLKEFVPSFIVNRIQNAIGSTVQEMLENGWASPEEIDRAVKLTLGVRLPIVGVVQTADFTGLDLVRDIFAGIGRPSAYFQGLVDQGRLGVKAGKGIYDYGDRTEADILRERDLRFLRMLDFLTATDAFEPL